jgi:hypothetical protein
MRNRLAKKLAMSTVAALTLWLLAAAGQYATAQRTDFKIHYHDGTVYSYRWTDYFSITFPVPIVVFAGVIAFALLKKRPDI